MQLEIQKWGNSAAIRLNKALLEQVASGIGGRVEAEVKNGGIFLKPVKQPRYTLDDLLANCDRDKIRLDEEDLAWLNDKPQGKEIW
jgi:antitoxin component of MazEF toxin-antitoxin module